MSTLQRHWPKLAAAVVLGVVAWTGYRSVYSRPKADIEAQIRDVRGSIASLNGVLAGQGEIKARTERVAKELLAGKLDVLSARFRDGLARAAETAGLTKVVVEHGQPVDVDSPLTQVRSVASDIKKQLRKTADFQIVRGTLRGSGSLEQAARTLGTLQVQPWVHRIEGFSLRPTSKDRQTFELRVDVATIYSPTLAAKAPSGQPMPELVTPPGEVESLWRAIASRNVFRKPETPAGQPGATPPVEVVAAAPGSAPPPVQPFAPYEDWKLTGVAEGRTGVQALFLNLKTGDRLTVLKGGQFLDAVFVDGEGEHAVVEIGGRRYDMSVGATLASRKPHG